jgi:hypothetical protein
MVKILYMTWMSHPFLLQLIDHFLLISHERSSLQRLCRPSLDISSSDDLIIVERIAIKEFRLI